MKAWTNSCFPFSLRLPGSSHIITHQKCALHNALQVLCCLLVPELCTSFPLLCCLRAADEGFYSSSCGNPFLSYRNWGLKSINWKKSFIGFPFEVMETFQLPFGWQKSVGKITVHGFPKTVPTPHSCRAGDSACSLFLVDYPLKKGNNSMWNSGRAAHIEKGKSWISKVHCVVGRKGGSEDFFHLKFYFPTSRKTAVSSPKRITAQITTGGCWGIVLSTPPFLAPLHIYLKKEILLNLFNQN